MLIQDTYNAPNIGVKVVVYGKAGMGKTVLCSTAPYPIILSAEQGLLSLRRMHVPFVVINSLQDLKDARLALEGKQGYEFQTICLDSISELAEGILSYERKRTNDPRKAYGEMSEQVSEEFRLFRRMPKHVVFTAKMGHYTDGFTGATMWGPMFPGQQLEKNVPYLYDELFELTTYRDATTGQDMRVLRTQPDNQHEAKDRSGSLAAWEHPHLGYVFNKIMKVGD